MSLSGNLEVFPLEEVLRLLARSRRDGCLRVEAAGHQGRVFLTGGGLSYATTESDDAVRRAIVNAGLVIDDRSLELGQVNLLEVGGDRNADAVHDFVREHIVEALYRLRKPGRGTFDFVLDLQPRHRTGVAVDVEVAVSEADRRAIEWADIEEAVPDLTVPFTMVPSLGDDGDVTLTPGTWKLLAAFGGSGTIAALADRLGSTDFRVAREIASLSRQGLIAAEQRAEPAQPISRPEPEGRFTTPEPAVPVEPAPGGWWQQATAPTEAPDYPPAEGSPEPEDAADSFLERVFAPAEDEATTETETEEHPEETFGMGLLRRRRMGSITEDIVDS
jgi:hypothetical protein